MLINLREKMKNQRGFTLVELMVVVAILGILAAVAVPKLTASNASARGARIVADLRTIDTAIQLAVANGTYTVGTAADLSGVAAVTANLNGVPVPPVGAYSINTHTGTVATGAVYGINAAGRAVLGTSGTLTASDLAN